MPTRWPHRHEALLLPCKMGAFCVSRHLDHVVARGVQVEIAGNLQIAR